MKIIVTTIASFLLLGCASSSSSGIYNPAKGSKEKLARIDAAPFIFLKDPMSTQILNVYNSEGKLVIGAGENRSFGQQDRWDTVYLASGKYRVMAHCNNADFFALPFKDITLISGDHFIVKCNRSKNVRGKIELNVTRQTQIN